MSTTGRGAPAQSATADREIRLLGHQCPRSDVRGVSPRCETCRGGGDRRDSRPPRLRAFEFRVGGSGSS